MEHSFDNRYEFMSDETIKSSYKPFDVVTDFYGNVGFISEVSFNLKNQNSEDSVMYYVEWIIGKNDSKKYKKDELKKHCNLFVKISECMCWRTFGPNKDFVDRLLGGIDK